VKAIQMMTPQAFLEALPSAGPAPELAGTENIFGWLIGSWDIDAVLSGAKDEVQKSQGEVHASWVLEGRAIQDLFIFPRRVDRHSGIPAHGDRYATTIRTYDRSLNVWRINFINPAADETSAQLIARRDGSDIVMDGKLADGTPIRWRYEALTATSFHYSAEKMRPGDKSWHLYLELFGKRAA
jgi:hypothetical protein